MDTTQQRHRRAMALFQALDAEGQESHNGDTKMYYS
jgi:hypothetical protein